MLLLLSSFFLLRIRYKCAACFLKVFGKGGRKAPGGKSEQWQPSSWWEKVATGKDSDCFCKEEVCSFTCRRSTPWGQPQPWVMSKPHSMCGHTWSPPQPFYFKPQRQADGKLEVWVTWVCSFARTVLGPHVPAPTLPVALQFSTPSTTPRGPPITKVAAVQFACLWLSWFFTTMVPTTCCAFDVTFQLTFPEDL